MVKYFLRRLVGALPLLFLISLITFSLVLMLPGDPALTIAGDAASDATLAAIRERLGENDPLIERYWNWVSGAVQGDFGQSLFNNITVRSAIAQRAPITVSLTIVSLAIALLISLPAGLIAGLRKGTVLDRLLTVGASMGVAIPSFWMGLLFSVFFAVKNKWLPAGGYVKLGEDPWEWFKHLVLPALTLGMSLAGVMQRQLRAAVIDVIGSKYITAAWARGGSPRTVVGKHALKNAAIPPITVLGLQVGYLIGGTVITEQVFAIPGLGTYMLRAIINLDMAVVQGVTLVFVLTTITMSLVVDLVYGLLNPKVRGA